MRYDEDDDHHFGDQDEYGLDDDDHMIEMRRRPVATTSSSSPGYLQVNTEDDELSSLTYHNDRLQDNERHKYSRVKTSNRVMNKIRRLRKLFPSEPPKGCATCCALFSCSGIVFLTILAVLINYNSQYLRLSQERLENKQELLEAVVGAILMYLGCFLISTYILYRSPVRREVEDGRFLH